MMSQVLILYFSVKNWLRLRRRLKLSSVLNRYDSLLEGFRAYVYNHSRFLTRMNYIFRAVRLIPQKIYKLPRPWAKVYKHLIYATPTFSNPTTLTMSLADREGLVRLAREFDALVVTDDVYDFLQWSPDPEQPLAQPDKAQIPRVVDVDRYLDGGPKDEWGNVVSNGSFSKLIGPGARTGWAEGTEKFAYGLSQTYVFNFSLK